MRADCHIHTAFSADSEAEPRAQIESAIRKGVEILCFTDHMDYDFGVEGDTFTFDPDAYFRALAPLAAEYAKEIRVLIGIEFGMQPHLRNRFEHLVRGWPFDYILGSQHLVFGMDPYYTEVFEGRRAEDVIDRWFDELSESIALFPEIHALAHIDYIFRYIREGQFPYERFEAQIGGILSELIRAGICLELNTGGFGRIRCVPGFHEALLDQYVKMGGKRITAGSDAHDPDGIRKDGEMLDSLLKMRPELHYTYYEKGVAKTL